MKVEIELPFSGFYESIHDDNITRMLESGFNYNHETGEDQEVPEAVWEADVDYGAIHNEYCREFVKMFGEEFNLDLEFIEMTSPREYNFSTDSIFCKVPKEQIDKIRKEVEQHEDWAEYIKERFTSRSGFWSFYSNDSTNEEWTKDVLDECQYRVVLEFWLEKNESDDWELYLMDDHLSSYELDSIGDAYKVIEEQIKENKVKEAVESISKAVDWMRDEYGGEHNMPTFAYESVQELQHAIKQLEGIYEKV